MKVTALGTQGWMPSKTRSGLCTAVETKGKLVLLELGTGLSTLLESELQKDLWDQHDEIHVLLSHFHLDHVIGVFYLPALAESKRIHLYSPAKILGLDTEQVLERLFSVPYSSSVPTDWGWLASITELSEGVQFIDDLELRVRKQIHPGGSLGFVLDNKFAQITDTICDRETADFVQGVNLLFHECWYLEPSGKGDHSHLPGIIEIARKAAIQQTGLIHLNPALTAEEYEQAIEELGAERLVKVVSDGEVFIL